MSFFERVVLFLQREAPRPTNYGWFHLTFIALVVIATVLLCKFATKISDKKFRIIVASLWGVMLGFEIYKQVVFSFGGEAGSWNYDWASFPYQLCSTPLYVLPVVAFVKDGKFRDGAINFISTFAFFGGVCVMVFPNDVFHTNMLGVQIQTMVHHGLQIILGIYVAVYNREKFNLKNLFKFGLAFFLALLVIALVLNVVMFNLVEDRFNMFYIGPKYECTLPLLSMIYPKVPYVAFFLIYSLGFVLCAVIMYYLIYGGMVLASKVLSKKKSRNNA